MQQIINIKNSHSLLTGKDHNTIIAHLRAKQPLLTNNKFLNIITGRKENKLRRKLYMSPNNESERTKNNLPRQMPCRPDRLVGRQRQTQKKIWNKNEEIYKSTYLQAVRAKKQPLDHGATDDRVVGGIQQRYNISAGVYGNTKQ
jgi:hypothetical protein